MSIVEVLLAAGVLAGLGVAVMVMTGQSVNALRVDRVRVAAEEICHATVERFGRGSDNVQVLMQPGDEPGAFVANNLWERAPDAYAAMGFTRVRELAAQNGLAMRLELKPVERGLDVLTCEVSWNGDRRGARAERVQYSRWILHDHVH